ncbi:sugar kinase [Umezawaea endophytica]|uniref:Sugar kinase n=1 Tax=Umezawaea endophytica TaxID=1654476 RepID=A0A9X2VVF2_9PSEU|nr:sugar kinase [Umezawaea endophytica]MCS7483558.1 sugar kinase [Umezawaea endophytica]
MTGVVTLGETMALLALPEGRIGVGTPVVVGIGGAESNVAIALARLDVPCTWISRVGDDALGTLVGREIRAEGVAVRARRSTDAPTGMMVKEHLGGRPSRVRYYRSGSAASRMSPADVDEAVVAEADVLHVTGITAALGPGPRAALAKAVEVARANGTLVSFDVNHRSTLWGSDEAVPVLSGLIAAADLVFAGSDEAALVLGRPGPDPLTPESGAELAEALVGLGPATAVVKLGELGSVANRADESVFAPTEPVRVVDPVGAGDAFVGGYLAELLRGGSLARCLAAGNVLGGIVCTVPGDWEGLPTRAELAARGNPHEVVR